MTQSSVAHRRLVVALFAVGLTLRLALLGVTPPFAAPDEAAHFRYIRYVATHHALPIQHARMGQTLDYEDYQPPLYYVVSAPVYVVGRRIAGNEIGALRALRGSSLILWLMTFASAVVVVRRLRLEGTLPGLVGIALVALLPTYVGLSTEINNDGLSVALSTAALAVAAGPIVRRSALVLGVLVGLALLAKLTAVSLVPTIVVLVLARRVPWREAALGAVATALVLCPFALRNIVTYGSVTAENVANIPYTWPDLSMAIHTVMRGIIPTFWSTYGVANGVSAYAPIAQNLTVGLLVAWLWTALTRWRHARVWLSTAAGSFIMAGACGSVVAVLLTVRFGLLYDQGQGRYLFPLLLPLGLAAGAALDGAGLSRLGRYRVPLCAFGMVVCAFCCVSIDIGSVGIIG